MALRYGNRVLETTTTTGTGAFALSAAITGYQRFSSIPSIATSDTVYYSAFAVDANGNPSGDWEVGLGTYSAANELTRTSVLASTNGGAAVSFAAGTKYVMCDVPASVVAAIARLDTANTFTGTIVAPKFQVATDANGAYELLARDGTSQGVQFINLAGEFTFYHNSGTILGALATTGLTLDTDLAVTEGGTGASDAAGARTNLAAAAQSQTGEQISGFIASPSDKSYTIALKMAHGGTITETTTISASGTCTATFKVNSTALGGTANSVSSAEQSQAHASNNTFSAGDDIVLTVSSNSSCADMSFTIKYTRTLA